MDYLKMARENLDLADKVGQARTVELAQGAALIAIAESFQKLVGDARESDFAYYAKELILTLTP